LKACGFIQSEAALFNKPFLSFVFFVLFLVKQDFYGVNRNE